MRHFCFIFLFFILTSPGFGQDLDWEVTYGFPGYDDYANDITIDYDKGYHLVSGSEYRSQKIKVTINGSLLHQNDFTHDDGIIRTWAIAKDEEGNIFIGGPMFYTEVYPWIAKFDSCGQKVWCRHFPNPEFYVGTGVWDIIVNNNNEILVLINYTTGNKSDQVFLAALDQNGKELWKNAYAKKEDYPLMVDPLGYDLLEHNGEYYISGDCYYPYPNNPTHVFLRPMFIGINSEFDEKWVTPFYALDSVFGWAESSIALNDTVLMGVGIRKLQGHRDNSLLAFYHINGEELGYSQLTNEQIGPEIQNNYIHEIEKINDTLFLAASPFGEETTLNPVGELIIDTAGNLYNFHSRPNTQQKPSLIKTSDNNFVIATSIKQGNHFDIYLYKIDENLEMVPMDTTQHVYDSLCPRPIPSGTMDLTDCLLVTNIGDIPGPAAYYESLRWIPIKAFPNPVKEGKVTLEFENTEYLPGVPPSVPHPPQSPQIGGKYPTLQILNAMGVKVHEERIYKRQQDTDLDVEGWPKGVYIAVIYSNGGAVGKCKFVVH